MPNAQLTGNAGESALFRGLNLWPVVLPAFAYLMLWQSGAALSAKWLAQGRYSHGFLVAGMSAYACFVVARSLDWRHAAPSVAGWVMLLGSTAFWLLALSIDLQTAHILAVVPIAHAILWAGAGWRIARSFLVPLALLVCAVPVWEPISAVLQRVAVEVCGRAVVLLGVPASIRGTLVFIPSGTFEIASGCSGVSFVMVALAVAMFLGVIERHSRREMLRFTAILLLVAVVSNWLRIVTIILCGHLTEMQHYLVKVDHYTFGWVLFGLTFGAALWALQGSHGVPSHTPTSTRPAPLHTDSPESHRILKSLMAPAVLLLAASVMAAAGVLKPAGVGAPLSWPTAAGAFAEPQQATMPDWQPAFPGAAYESTTEFRLGTLSFFAYANSYRTQRNGAELVGSDSTILGPKARAVGSFIVRVADNGIGPDAGKEAAGIEWRDRQGNRWITAYLYRIGRRVTAREVSAKLSQLLLIGSPSQALGIIAVSGRCELDCDLTTRLAVELLLDLNRSDLHRGAD